jgi:hypothetical protein
MVKSIGIPHNNLPYYAILYYELNLASAETTLLYVWQYNPVY